MVKTSIFLGMPTLLSGQQRNSFETDWPLCKELPPLINKQFSYPLPLEKFSLSYITDQGVENLKQEESAKQSNFKLRKVKPITDCPHKNKKHYAKNMCSNCYSKLLRVNKVPICGHPEKEVFSRKMCLQCYTKAYRASKKRN